MGRIDSVGQDAQEPVQRRKGRVEAGPPGFGTTRLAAVPAIAATPAGKDEQVPCTGTRHVEQAAHLRGVAFLVDLVNPLARSPPSLRAAVGAADLEGETQLRIDENGRSPRLAHRGAFRDHHHGKLEPLRGMHGHHADRVRVAFLDHGGVGFALIEILHPPGERDEAPRGAARDLVLASERYQFLDVRHGLLAGETRSDRRQVIRLGKRRL